MKIGIVGGTGGMGMGFSIRWCKDHDILIGSRDEKKASDSAKEYSEKVKELGISMPHSITGMDNAQVAKESDVLVLSIPYENVDKVCSQLLPLIRDDCIVICSVVPLKKTDNGFEFISFAENQPSAYDKVKAHMKNPSRIVSAFHTISEKKLVDPTMELDSDIFVCGDDKDAVKVVSNLIESIKGLRPIFLGPGPLSYLAEASTPLLLNAMIQNKMRNPGIKIVS